MEPIKATLNWVDNDYFSILIYGDKRSNSGLEMLVEDLHTNKDITINTFLAHSGCEDFLWGLVRLLGSDNPRLELYYLNYILKLCTT